MIRKLLLTAIVAAAFAPAMGAAQVVPSDKDIQDIAEATLRDMFSKSGDMTRCITLPGPAGGPAQADPSPAFLARFRDLKAPVRTPAGCQGKLPDGMGIADTQTGVMAMAFKIEQPVCTSPTECDVAAEYYTGPMSAARWTYHLRRTDGKWTVIGEDMQWIS